MRRLQGKPLLQRIETVAPPPLEVIDLHFGTILVPLKQRGPIEEEMLAIACKLAQEQGAARARRERRRGAARASRWTRPSRAPTRSEERLRELTAMFSQDYGVRVDFLALRSRAISGEVARVAREEDVGLILVGAVPHIGALAGRAQVFSETIENLLRRAHCRVIVTSFPPGTASVAEEAPDEARRAHPARARRRSPRPASRRGASRRAAASARCGQSPQRRGRAQRSSCGPSTTATSSVATPMPT